MPLLFRLLLIGVLALAVPLKGLAAVSMIGCGPGHHSQATDHAGNGHAGHTGDHANGGADSASMHSTSAHGAALGVASDMAVDEAVDDGRVEPASPHIVKCSSCAPCCAAAAPAPAELSVLAPDLSADERARVEILESGVVADVPHGPPRAPLA